jgi:hypothetical protein
MSDTHGRRDGELDTVADLVFPHLPPGVQAITLPALSKAWKQWAEDHGAKERALQEVKSWRLQFIPNMYVPLWAAQQQQQQQQQQLSYQQKRRFQLGAVAHGDVAAVEWCGFDTDDLGLCSTAAYGGQLQALQWLRDRGCAWKANTCEAAARNGHLAVLQWARANGCDWDSRTCETAARGGHLAVLQWARANGCDWDADTCAAAAGNGDLAVLQWARANGCELDAETCDAAADGGHWAVLDWARANGCPYEGDY